MDQDPTIKEPTIALVRRKNILELVDTFREYVRDRNSGIVLEQEILEIMQRIAGSIGDADFSEYEDYNYLVVCDDDLKAVGICGLRPPEEDMLPFGEGERTLELVNFFVNSEYGRQGLGKKLMDQVLQYAASMGYKYVIWNSGPRYKEKGHAFYRKYFGEPIAILKEKYGEDGDAPVWRVDLDIIRANY